MTGAAAAYRRLASRWVPIRQLAALPSRGSGSRADWRSGGAVVVRTISRCGARRDCTEPAMPSSWSSSILSAEFRPAGPGRCPTVGQAHGLGEVVVVGMADDRQVLRDAHTGFVGLGKDDAHGHLIGGAEDCGGLGTVGGPGERRVRNASCPLRTVKSTPEVPLQTGRGSQRPSPMMSWKAWIRTLGTSKLRSGFVVAVAGARCPCGPARSGGALRWRQRRSRRCQCRGTPRHGLPPPPAGCRFYPDASISSWVSAMQRTSRASICL